MSLPKLLFALLAMREPSKTRHIPLFVVFGIPGSGKSTVASKAIDMLVEAKQSSSAESFQPLCLDLDVCVPQWMRDNFARGIYPSLSQREEFAASCCAYVDESLQQAITTASMNEGGERGVTAAVISFSFVNEDLRDNFRKRFPESQWVLIQTAEDEAQRRIAQREGHFYKGKAATVVRDELFSSDDSRNNKQPNDDTTDNSEWDFAPVAFPHTILDGNNPIEQNAAEVAKMVQRAFLRVA